MPATADRSTSSPQLFAPTIIMINASRPPRGAEDCHCAHFWCDLRVEL